VPAGYVSLLPRTWYQYVVSAVRPVSTNGEVVATCSQVPGAPPASSAFHSVTPVRLVPVSLKVTVICVSESGFGEAWATNAFTSMVRAWPCRS
jgi:hypothetical protein